MWMPTAHGTRRPPGVLSGMRSMIGYTAAVGEKVRGYRTGTRPRHAVRPGYALRPIPYNCFISIVAQELACPLRDDEIQGPDVSKRGDTGRIKKVFSSPLSPGREVPQSPIR